MTEVDMEEIPMAEEDPKVLDGSDEEDLKAEKDEDEEAEEEELSGFDLARQMVGKGIIYAVYLLIVIYLLAAFIIDFDFATALFCITLTVVIYNIYAFWASKNEESIEAAEKALVDFLERSDNDWKLGGGLASILIIIMVIIVAVTVRDSRNMISLFGLLCFIALTWLFSWKPTKVKIRPVVGGIFIQFIFGYVVIRTDWGFEAINFLAEIFTTLLDYTYAGSSFVFGWLVDGSLFNPNTKFQLTDLSGEDAGTYALGPPFFFNVLPSVIFFSALMSVGYYIRALPWAVGKIGYVLAVLLGTSASESLSAAGNIFVGQTEAPLLVKPFLAGMTESELHAIMTGGFATIAGSVYGIYISFGINGVALLAASVMSAPAALAISKVSYPETEDSPTAVRKKGAYEIPDSGDANIVDAAAQGAVVGTQLMLNIAGNLIAFLAIIEMIDQLLIYLGNRVDLDLSFNRLCECLFYPVAWLMGVDGDDCNEVAILLGLKIFANEFVAYERLAFTDLGLSARSYYIASYALCGFSNFGSIGIQLGGLTPLAPNQGPALAKLVFSAMIAGNTACLMTACIAGILYEEDDA